MLRFWYDLTLALGHKSVAECQRWVSPDEFTYWMAYHKRNPINGSRGDWVLSLIANLYALFVNIHSKKRNAVKPDKFIPDWLKPKQRFDWRVMKERRRIASIAHNKRLLQDGRENKNS